MKQLVTLINGDTMPFIEIDVVGGLKKDGSGTFFTIKLQSGNEVVVSSNVGGFGKSDQYVSEESVDRCHRMLLGQLEKYIQSQMEDDDY